MELRSGFPKDEVASLADRYEYGEKDHLPREIGERARHAGYFSGEDFLAICEWKSARPRRRQLLNSETEIRELTRYALGPKTAEEDRIGSLLKLNGVSWATGSVLLHFAHQEPYPIIDIRALWSLGYDNSPHYTFSLWWDYVQTCRRMMKEFEVPMRVLDRALWQYSREQNPPRRRGSCQ